MRIVSILWAQAIGSAPRTLITGGLGQLGRGLAKVLREKHGKENVILSDIVKCPSEDVKPYVYADTLDVRQLDTTIVNYDIDRVVHFAALLSAVAEQNVSRGLQVNATGFQNVADVCRRHGLALFCPSTIGAFGPTSPRNPTPDLTIQRPHTIYGVTKVYMELLGEYYHHKFGVDFRSLRFPGVISADTAPGGGTTDYAVHIFHAAKATGHYKCFLRDNTLLPMMYLPDCIRANIEMMDVPAEKLKSRVYNVTAMSFTPAQLVEEMKHYYPHLTVEYEPDSRQQIADTWPEVFDDSGARADWGWSHDYNLTRLVETMVTRIDPNNPRLRT